MTTYISDHTARALGFIASQFKDKPKIRAIVEAAGVEVQRAEDALADLAYGLRPDSATGAALDQLGRMVGEAREGLSDAVYRGFVRARPLIDQGGSSVNQIIEMASRLLGDVRVEYRPAHPAAYRLQYTLVAPISQGLRARILARIREATPAGVGVELVESVSTDNPFTFDAEGMGFDAGELTGIYS